MSKTAKIIIIGILSILLFGLILYLILSSQKEMSCEQALERTKTQNDINQVLMENPNMKISCDSQDKNGWLIHVYEIVQPEGLPSHTATYGWYVVKPDGQVEDFMF